jgi:YfiH family protein
MPVEILAADWPAPDGFVAGTTTRAGGVSRGRYTTLNLGGHVGDHADDVAENRRRFVAAAGLPREPAWLTQVHGADVAEAGSPGPREADAVVSRDGGAPLGILTADCLPIVLCSVATRETAALHCGWRSLAGGLVANTIGRLESPPSSLMAWLGPAIAQAAFEVGDDVRDIFLAGVDDAAACFEPNARGRWQADLYALARRYLAAAGVTSVYGGGLCTYRDEQRFFSYRRDGSTGRMATFIASVATGPRRS